MPEIYTTQWYDALKRLLNENPAVDKNAPRGTFHVLGKIVGDAASLYMPVGKVSNFVVVFADGKCLEYRQVEIRATAQRVRFYIRVASVSVRGCCGRIDRSYRRGA